MSDKGKYIEVKGDVLEVNCNRLTILAHVCNNIGAWGAGFTKSLDAVYPRVGQVYKQHMSETSYADIIGTNHKVKLCAYLTVINMIAQDGLPSQDNPKPIKYEGLVECMRGVVIFAKYNRYNNIICPKFGAGLAGGNWNFIEELIQEIWIDEGLNVTVYELE